MPAATESLRYLDATHVGGPAGKLWDFDVSDASGLALGKLAGVVVDPAARRLRYFVVEAGRWLSRHRYLIPLCPATLQSEQHAMKLECDRDATGEWRTFDDHLFPPFSDDDLLDALFCRGRTDTAAAEIDG